MFLQTQQAQWVTYLDLGIKGGTLLVTISVALLVAFLNRYNMRYETRVKQNRFKMDKQVEAGMAFWALLTYVTETENDHSILLWEREKNGKGKTWFVRIDKANEFMQKLNEVNYEKGHGFFMSSDTREYFYKYRAIVFGICLSEKLNPANKIQIKEEVAREMVRMYDRMNKALREEIQPENLKS